MLLVLLAGGRQALVGVSDHLHTLPAESAAASRDRRLPADTAGGVGGAIL